MGAAQLKVKKSALSIGQVMAALCTEFNDLTPSKLRFLEDKGLICPDRTASGYRKFTQWHIERLRLILTLQRDYFLPLKAICDLLEQVDQGLDPQIPGASDKSFSSIFAPRKVIDQAELQRLAGTTSAFLQDVIKYELMPAQNVYSADSVQLLKALYSLAQLGLTPRHLRAIKLAAIREAELIAGVIATRGKAPRAQKTEQELEIAGLLDTVHSAMVRQVLATEK